MTKIAIAGVAGRMGKALVEAMAGYPDLQLGAATSRAGCDSIGKDAGEWMGRKLGVAICADLNQVLEDFEVLIDFTLPEATLAHLAVCAGAGRKMVIGTTGFTQAQKDTIAAAAEKTAIVCAPNMSVGVNLSYRLIELAAKIIGNDSDIEVIEAHHRNKIDAPSGTALRMGEVLAQTLQRDLDKDAIYGRQGNTGVRDAKTIAFSTIRAGDIVGDHTVMFAGQGERIEITHKASSRLTFAGGAMKAARWLAKKDRGLFDMQDVLGLADIKF